MAKIAIHAPVEPQYYVLRNDLIDLVTGSEGTHGIRCHHIHVALKILSNTQDALFKRHIGDLGLLEAPLPFAFGRHVDSA